MGELYLAAYEKKHGESLTPEMRRDLFLLAATYIRQGAYFEPDPERGAEELIQAALDGKSAADICWRNHG